MKSLDTKRVWSIQSYNKLLCRYTPNCLSADRSCSDTVV